MWVSVWLYECQCQGSLFRRNKHYIPFLRVPHLWPLRTYTVFSSNSIGGKDKSFCQEPFPQAPVAWGFTTATGHARALSGQRMVRVQFELVSLNLSASVLHFSVTICRCNCWYLFTKRTIGDDICTIACRIPSQSRRWALIVEPKQQHWRITEILTKFWRAQKHAACLSVISAKI